MAMLGDLLATARDGAARFGPWLGEADPELARRLEAAAAREGMTVTGFVRMAVADFNRFAAEEDWATLVSALRDSQDPGTACLVAMVDWRLTVRGCGTHDFNPQRQGAADERPAQGRSG